MILFNPYTHNSFIWMMLKVFMFSNFCWYLNNLTSVSCQHKRLSQLIPQFCRACIIWSYFWHGEYNSRRYILIYTALSIVVEVTNHIYRKQNNFKHTNPKPYRILPISDLLESWNRSLCFWQSHKLVQWNYRRCTAENILIYWNHRTHSLVYQLCFNNKIHVLFLCGV